MVTKLYGYQIVELPDSIGLPDFQVTKMLATKFLLNKFSYYQIVELPNCWIPNC